MPEGSYRYCDVSLPVPLDRLFSYELPPTLRHRVQPGCRVVAPLGTRKLTGVVLRVHDDADNQNLREVLSLTDEEPVLEPRTDRLGHWIAEYYCAPLGEVLKGMLPLGGETRRSIQYSLTESGRQVARQLVIRPESDASLRLLAMLDERPRTANQLTAKIPNARTLLKGLTQRGWVSAEEKEEDRDPMRASAERLEAEFLRRADDSIKLKKGERELLAFLELHPGPHNLAELRPK
jgi:primosomal protein N' (replication factor Y)